MEAVASRGGVKLFFSHLYSEGIPLSAVRAVTSLDH